MNKAKAKATPAPAYLDLGTRRKARRARWRVSDCVLDRHNVNVNIIIINCGIRRMFVCILSRCSGFE